MVQITFFDIDLGEGEVGIQVVRADAVPFLAFILSGVTRFLSNSMSAEREARFTLADCTPSSLFSVSSTEAEHPAQRMPSTAMVFLIMAYSAASKPIAVMASFISVKPVLVSSYVIYNANI